MPIVRLQVDVSGTLGEEVWRNLRHFDLAEVASMESHPQSGEMCKHPADAVHAEGEFLSATIQVENHAAGTIRGSPLPRAEPCVGCRREQRVLVKWTWRQHSRRSRR
jgi:hypothetical protein